MAFRIFGSKGQNFPAYNMGLCSKISRVLKKQLRSNNSHILIVKCSFSCWVSPTVTGHTRCPLIWMILCVLHMNGYCIVLLTGLNVVDIFITFDQLFGFPFHI